MKTLLHYLFLLCFNILLPAVHSQCIKDQQQSLLHLKKSLQFDQPSRQTPLISWNSSTDCCSWVGVTCTSDGHVVGLDLSNKTISGPIVGSFANFSNLRVLNLSSNTISGTVPGFFANFSKLTSLNLSGCWLNGIFPNEIFQVPTLQTIDLSANFKLGGSLPEFPKKIGSLQSLSLSKTNFSGSLPDSIGNLKMLSTIDLSNCSFHGSIPSSLFSLPLLSQLNLSHNQFSGELAISNVSSNLVTLDLSFNNLEGQISVSIFNFQGLQSLNLSSNNFTAFPFNGPQQLENLTNIDLSYNSLLSLYNGTDSSYSSFPQLDSLNLAANKLGTIPYFLRNQSTLFSVDLSENHIRGKIPRWIWSFNQLSTLNLSCNYLVTLEAPLLNSTVKTVDLHSNKLQGQIPTFLPSAKYLDYSRNNFSSIPSNIGDFLTNTLFFSLSSNNLHGLIPASICNASNLQILNLSNNSLSGMITQCLTAMRDLSVLNLARNNLIGSISNVEVTEDSSLQILEIGGNQLGGKVPKSLAKCIKLEVLNIGNNNITDSFPCLLKNISTLRVLILRSNNFYGGIECLNTNGTWPGVQIIDLAHNNFSGEIQGILWRTWREMMATENGSLSTIAFGSHTKRKTLASMTATSCNRASDRSCRGYQNVVPSRAESCPSDSTNRLCHHYAVASSSNAYAGSSNADDGYSLEYSVSVTVTSKGLEMELVKILSIFTLIDFSSNNFSGPIPTEIGEFKSLCVLNLSRNAFTGEIPSKFGNMQVLESLDLSQNKLSGRIPPLLAELTFLSFLNLSYNQLVGRIPTSNQFSTFSASSFIGNKGLWGFPLTVDNKAGFPPPPTMNGRSPNSGHHHEVNWDLISAEIGFIVGFGVAVGSLVSCKRWRKWYYRAMYNILLKIFPQLEDRIGIHRKHVHINQR
ncbi:PREDICTED: probable LRR receptor-like serine/threonine-protein kinase At4g36180 [Prunus mume]|uniref:Probable LRR receptor-like serine/threonine-protein kinase At4g36180 n=1 Tax=Prunus mume TaxID=102107 RepID=A0ABM1LLU1_PRUMU|nr:PREDICTED: probable LRR receptor-like serine/threonine-protein kinase At4g36180 [Prunus mume]XP_016648371.1 PREDICTED: probable LRR receptor-like serine/threonine-protein kinase At4g36180 [Prunus mume]